MLAKASIQAALLPLFLAFEVWPKYGIIALDARLHGNTGEKDSFQERAQQTYKERPWACFF